MQQRKFNYFFLTIAIINSVFANDLEQQYNAELDHIQRQLERQEYSTLLANSLSGNGFPLLTTIQKTILEKFEISQIEEIYHDALEEIFYEQPLADICLKIWKVFIQNSKNSKAFESMVRSQLTLYSLYTMYRQLDYKYLIQFALTLHRITKELFYENYYQQLDEILKQRLDLAIKDLPTSLWNFFFESTFCLVNQMSKEMLYNSKQPIFPQDQELLYVLTSPYPACQLNSSSILEMGIYYNNGNITDLNIMLTSSPRKWMFIKAEYLPFLTASQKGYTNQIYNLWWIDLVSEESLIFKSKVSGGFMCLADKTSNVVNVLEGVEAKGNELCQWKAIKCDNKCL